MNENTLAKRYANAFAELAAERNHLEKAGEELNAFLNALKELPPLRTLFVSPTSAQKDQQTALTTILESASFAEVTQKFLRLLIDKRRMVLIESIVSSYNRIVEERSGRLSVLVRTARPLTNSHKDRLTNSLSQKTGKEVVLEIKEDPTLLGGLVVRIGSVMMDFSVRNRLNRLKEIMRG
ncbi:ATP synthase F1 subunit delta [Magnetococcales bacterium HHB-1]